MTLADAVQLDDPDSKPGLSSFWPGLLQPPVPPVPPPIVQLNVVLPLAFVLSFAVTVVE